MAEVMAEAERGNLPARTDARYADALGLLQRSFNRMPESLGLLVGTVPREADGLTAQLGSHRRYAEEGARHTIQAMGASEQAMGVSERLRGRAEEMEASELAEESGLLQRRSPTRSV